MRQKNSSPPLSAGNVAATGTAATPVSGSHVKSQHKHTRYDGDWIAVTENLPEDYPITSAELAVLETYLGGILDAVFAEIFDGSGTGGEGRSRRGLSSSGAAAEQQKLPGTNHAKTDGRGKQRRE
jgi:hypothetical protein